MEMSTGARRSGRIYFIDSLKGFAILLVVIGHILDGYINTELFAEKRQLMFAIYSFIYAFHMPLFFMISGYVFKAAYFKDDGSVKPSLKKQIYNTLAVYIIYSLLFGALKILLSRFTRCDVYIRDLFMIWIKPISHYWYMYVLLLLYVLFSGKTANRFLPRQNIGLLAALTLISCLSGFIPEEYGYFFEVKRLMLHAVFFLTGMLLFSKKPEWISSPATALISFAVSVILMALFRKRFDFAYYGRSFNLIPVINFIIALGFSLMLFYVFEMLFSDENAVRVRALSFLGKHSLEIYVIHTIFTTGCKVILGKLNVNALWLNIICNLVISVSVPVIGSILLKKLGIHGLFFKPVTYFINKKDKSANGGKA